MSNDDDEIVRRFFDHVDQRERLYINRLAEAVSIPSVSSELEEHLDDVVRMIDWTKAHAERLGGTCTLVPNPAATSERPLPPILMGEFLVNPAKKTVCVYGHLDVQPAKLEDGWDSEPFVLTERDGKLFGRGSTDDKGPALSWLWVIEAFQELGIELPVNIKILYEGLEEFGSDGLFQTVQTEAQPGRFLNDVDFFCISDNYWLGKRKPCLTYGLRGLAYFTVSVQCSEQDLHSGTFGGSVHEAMTDLVHLMASLVDSKGNIIIDGILDDVEPRTPEEDALYPPIDFDPEEYKQESGVKSVSDKLLHDNKVSLLMARWRYPSLSLHGIEGAFSGKGMKTVIPGKVVGKFSIRLVPFQKPARIEALVKSHLERKMAELGSPNKLEVSLAWGSHAWESKPSHPNYQAAARAIERVFGVTPDFTREGGSIPITGEIEDVTGMNVLLLPIGACDDMAHSQNEKFNIVNLMQGIKVLGMYILELGKLKGPKPSTCRCLPTMTEEDLMVPGAFVRGFRCSCEM